MAVFTDKQMKSRLNQIDVSIEVKLGNRYNFCLKNDFEIILPFTMFLVALFCSYSYVKLFISGFCGGDVVSIINSRKEVIYDGYLVGVINTKK